MRNVFLVFLSICTAMALFTGCGSKGTTFGAQPGPGTNQPTPAPGASGSAQFTESMLANNGSGSVAGQVMVNQNGSGTVNITGAAPNTSFTLQFCPFADPTGACTTMMTVTSTMAGAVSATFTMPGHGGFAGIFQLTSGSTVAFVSGFNVPANGSVLQASLVRASTVTAGFGVETQAGLGVGFDPLSSGLISVNNGETVHVQVQGAAANQSYDVTFCRNGGGSSCFGVGAITTDASGNGSADLQLGTSVGVGPGDSGVFILATGKPPAIQFVSGFTVP